MDKVKEILEEMALVLKKMDFLIEKIGETQN